MARQHFQESSSSLLISILSQKVVDLMVLLGRDQIVRIALTGDAMLGRLIDQLLPNPLHDLEHGYHGSVLRAQLGLPSSSTHSKALTDQFIRPWGDVLPIFHEADLRIINLETSITTETEKYPGKAFNFRMSPENIRTLQEAKVNYASLANNHILDYGVKGMQDTIYNLNVARILHAGAGMDFHEAWQPAILEHSGIKILVYSFTDHGTGRVDIDGKDPWAAEPNRPGINFLPLGGNFSIECMESINQHIAADKNLYCADIVILSIHWGPNYSWQPSPTIQIFARILTDPVNGAVNVIHGHSSHHVQGIEKRSNGSLIIYGCGDFIDDYAVDGDYRNDLGAIYMLDIQIKKPHELLTLRCIPTHIANFAVHLLHPHDQEYKIVRRNLLLLSDDLNTKEGIPLSTDPPMYNSAIAFPLADQ